MQQVLPGGILLGNMNPIQKERMRMEYELEDLPAN